MIVSLILNIIVLVIGIIFTFLPAISTLPPLFGYDIDKALVTNFGYVARFMYYFWPVGYLYMFLQAILGYHIVKIVFRLFFGSRAPQ